MIKRNTHFFTRQNAFQDFLDTMDEGTTISHYAVNDNGTHYIITEHELTKKEAIQFKIKQLEKQLEECNTHYTNRIKACDSSINMYNKALNYEMANLYMQRREDAIEEYNNEQRKLTKQLDKLKYPDYNGFIE